MPNVVPLVLSIIFCGSNALLREGRRQELPGWLERALRISQDDGHTGRRAGAAPAAPARRRSLAELYPEEPAEPAPRIHFVYTTGCNTYQLLQSVALDHSWRAAGNAGRLTRIVAGCQSADAREELHRSPLKDDPDFGVFVDPRDLSKNPATGEVYPARSRPHAIQLWLEEARPAEPLVAVLDPDFVFVRPLSAHPGVALVRPGHMLSQPYDIGTNALKGFAAAGEATPPVSDDQMWSEYSTGPPWVLHKADLQRLFQDWQRYTDAWPAAEGLLREQNSFIMATVRANLTVEADPGLIVSSQFAYHEAWSEGHDDPAQWKPYILHYCQTYRYGTWTFHKSYVSDGWYEQSFENQVRTPIECGAPLLAEPPRAPGIEEEPDAGKRRDAYMIAEILPRLNAAYAAYREGSCPGESARELFGRMAHFRTVYPRVCSYKIDDAVTRYMTTRATAAPWDDPAAAGENPCSEAAQLDEGAASRRLLARQRLEMRAPDWLK